MDIKKKRTGVIIDVVIIVVVVSLGIFLRLPYDSSIGNAQMNNELTDDDCYYLSDPDSYLYARKARQYSLDLTGFTLVNTRTEDYMMSPVSTRENGLVTNFLPLLAALVFRFLNLFSDITIEMVVYYINAVICALAAVPVYLYMRKQTNVVGGAVSAFLIVTAVPFLEHSVAGYFDTDAMLCTIPICLILSFAMMVESETLKKKTVYAVLSLISFFVLATTWETFYIYFGILCVLSFITIMQLLFVKGAEGRLDRKETRVDVLYIVVSLIVMVGISFLIYGSTIIDSIRRLLNNMLVINNYPDSTKYIVELSDIPLLDNGVEGAFLTTGSGIVNKLGGAIVIIMAFIGIFLLLFARKRKSVRFFSCNMGFIVSWFLITLPFLIVGVRFLQLVCIPLILLTGLSAGILSEIMTVTAGKRIGYILSAFLAVMLVFGPVSGAFLRKGSPSPFYNKTFDGACTWINNYGSENADILTWWDFGYFIEFASARHVLSDGGTFDGRYFYWLAHALLTDNPKLSVGIFNMLDFSGVDGNDVAEGYLGSAEMACSALLDILPVDIVEANRILTTRYGLSESEAAELIRVTKPIIKDERYLIISRDLISKIGALSYYGFYDFDDVAPNTSLGVSTTPVVPTIFEEKTSIRGINNVYVLIKKDENNEYVTLIDEAGEIVDISRIITVENGVKIKDERKGNIGYTLYCINDNGFYSFIVCSDNIADSMLVSLMALNSNSEYTRVCESVLGDNLISVDSVTARFFGDSSTPDNAGVYIYKVVGQE